ncbi:MAG: SUMF1/EgtB/PvdO family nonheme iron enzyme [Theionarchaea archaeon]|nr:SUMF1/EgtB/PvdO family nonheme iron enzyme [Theionarchaea archaeon]
MKESHYVEKKLYSISEKQIEIGDFFISTTLLTNEFVMEMVNALKIENGKGGAYIIFNEFNPSLPIQWNQDMQCYRIKKGYKDHPVCGITWQGALLIAFLVGGRLPFELEWEACATSGDLKKKYPWGDEEPSAQLANYGEHIGSTTPVKRYPPNEWGLYDMAGSAEEWCMDWYYPDHFYTAHQSIPGVHRYGEKTVKGGSWNKGAKRLQCTSRRGKWYRIGTVGIGARILWDSQPMEVIPWLRTATTATHI